MLNKSHFFMNLHINDYEKILEMAFTGVIIVDFSGKILDCCETMKMMLGYGSDEIKAVSIYDLDKNLTEEDYGRFVSEISEKALTFERVYTKKDGSEYHTQITAKTAFFNGVPAVYAVSRDISEYKRREDELKQSQNLLNKLSEQVPGMIYQYRYFPDGRSCFPFTSEHIRDIYEVSPEDVRYDASKVLAVLHPDDSGIVMDTISASFRSLVPWECDYRVRLPEKGVRWLRGYANPEKLDDGSVVWHGYIHDITERKQIEILLQQERELFSEGPVVSFVWKPDAEWSVEYVSQNCASVLGYSPESFYNGCISYKELIHPDDIKKVSEEVRYFVEKGACSFEQVYRLRLNNGEYRWFYDYTKLIRNEYGIVVSIKGYIFDQNEQKTLEQDLIAQQSQLRSIIEGTRAGTWQWNVQTGELMVNSRWAEIIGYTLDELYPVTIDTWAAFVHPEDLELSNRSIKEYFEGTLDYYQLECRMKHKNGSWIWISDRGMISSRTEDGKPLWMHGTHLDISSRKYADMKIQQSEAKFRNIFEYAAIGMSRADLEGWYIEVNSKFCQILGYSKEEILNMNFLDITKSEDVMGDISQLKKLIDKVIPSFSREKRFINKNGNIVWGRVTTSLVQEGDKQYFVSSLEDITETKNIQLQLEKSQKELTAVNSKLNELVKVEVDKRIKISERYRQLFNIVHEGLCVHSFNEMMPSCFIEVNEKMCSIFGYTRDEFLKMTPMDLHTPESLKYLAENAARIHDHGSMEFEAELVTKDGRIIHCELNSSVNLLEGESVVFTSIRDITETRKLKLDNEQKQQLLIQQSKLADMGSMIAAIAHQWKQPLNVISLTAGVLESDNEENGEIIELVSTINDQIAYMSETINDFRSFFSPAKEKGLFSILKAVEQVLRILSPKMKTQNITVVVKGDEDVPAYGFKNEFMQVVMNIINNARDALVERHVKSGLITVTISHKNDISSVSISDNGGGIPEKYLPELIFEPYFTTKGNDGTGIGLSMAKTIIEKYMGGSLAAFNKGDGAEFLIKLHAVEENLKPDETRKDRCVLYVEDDEFALEKTSELLEKHFKNVFRAKNGEEGLMLYEKYRELISVVLTDIDMPVMNGIAMSRLIKEINSDVPIVVLTAIKEDVIENAGFSAVFEKPVNIKKLLETLLSV